MRHSIAIIFNYYFLIVGLIILTHSLNAQTELNTDGFLHQIDFSGNYIDYQIPANPLQDHIEFFLDGGDGGKHNGCDARGGQGARVATVFKIGTGPGELRPGGIIRFIVGERGANRSGSNARGGAEAKGGGGGGTAILYRRSSANDNAGPEPFFSYASQGWAILAVAGGGGGGFSARNDSNICFGTKGGDGGTITTSGTSGGGTNDGGTNGNGGKSGMDNDNSSQSCSFTITVNDDVPPVAACRDAVIPYGDVFNDFVPFVNDGSFDNCNIAQISLSQNSFGCAEVGDNEVTLTVIDDAGNTSTCSATVTVQDDPAPLTITCPTNIVTTVDQGSCSKLLSSGFTPSWSGTCSNMLSYEITSANADPSDPPISGMGEITSFNFASGTSTIEYTITTGDYQTASCSFTIMVEDNIAPVANCQDATVQVETPIINSASLINNNSTDNCELASLTTSGLDINCDNIGANEVVLTATDESGNASTCLATVTITEDIPPTALCKDVTIQLNAAGNGTLIANYVDNGTFDDCSDIVYLELDQDAFDCTELGENTVTLTATDLSDNTATCTATVTVEDNVAPAANCQDITVGLSTSPITLNEVNNGSSDNCTAADQLLLNFSNPGSSSPGGPFFLLSCEDIGETILQLNVFDHSSNYNSCLATITVVDNLPPNANCMDYAIELPLDASGQATLAVEDVDNNSSDVCELGPLSLNQTDFDCNDLGLNTVVLTASDAAGNTNTCTANVEIIDNTPPTAQCQDATVNLDADGLGSLSANEVNDGSSDICSTINFSLDLTDFDCGDVGNNSVILTVADEAGNTSTCEAIVRVKDNIPPVINCKDVTVQLNQNGTKIFNTSNVQDGPITDACGLFPISSMSAFLTCDDVGTFIQPLLVRDQNSNFSGCSGTVTVEDNVPPTAVCQDFTVVLNETGSVTISPDVIDNGSSDACGIADMTLDVPIINCTDINGSEVTLTVTDNNGNTSSCQGTVTAIDDIPPVVICPGYHPYFRVARRRTGCP